MKILNIIKTLKDHGFALTKSEGGYRLDDRESAVFIRNKIIAEGYDVLNFKDVAVISESWGYIVYGTSDSGLKIKLYNDQILRVLNTTTRLSDRMAKMA